MILAWHARTTRRLVAAVVTALVSGSGVLAGGASVASADTRVVFTIDVESNETFTLPDQVDAICRDGSPCGLNAIVRPLQERHWPGTFFLNVYEHKKWGETAMRDIAVGLQTAGQDVALHTHPHWAYDPARWAMYDYSLDEQIAIVRDGVRLLGAWTGRPVVAHRAGAYTANAHTIEALDRNGVLLDSSWFWEHPFCRLDTLGLPRNLPSIHGRVVQVPVTAYVREDRPQAIGRFVAPLMAVRKIDPDWFVTADEARAAIDGIVAADIPVLVVFLHSFSLMGAPGGGRPEPDRHSMEMFRVVLDHVARKNLTVVTMRDLAAEGEAIVAAKTAATNAKADKNGAGRDAGKDIVPHVTSTISLPRYLARRARRSTSFAVAMAAGAVAGVAVLAVSLWYLRARRRQAAAAAARLQGDGRWAPAAQKGARSR